MKNVTVSLDDETHRLARIRAAELGTSLSALVKEYLLGLTADGGDKKSTLAEQRAEFIPAPSNVQGANSADGSERTYTPAGIPRRPGALRKLAGNVDLPETPDWLATVTEHWDEQDFDPLP